MTKVQNLFPLFYEIPTDTVLQHRKTFYSTQKETEEPITEWFYRIRSIIEYCDYGDFSNFLIIDKFFCGLDDDAKRWLRKTKTWSTDRLFQAITDPKFLNENANSEGVIVENRLEMDELLKVELDNVVSSVSQDPKYSLPYFYPNIIVIVEFFRPNRKVLHHFSIAIPILVM